MALIRAYERVNSGANILGGPRVISPRRPFRAPTASSDGRLNGTAFEPVSLQERATRALARSGGFLDGFAPIMFGNC